MISNLEKIARQDNNILEIDGPPMAYFEIPLDTVSQETDYQARSVLRVVYIGLIWSITREHFEDNLQNSVIKDLIEAVRDELFKLGGGIIWWRTRPMLDIYNGPQGQVFNIRCRVATSPMLPDEVWDKLGRKRDGECLY